MPSTMSSDTVRSSMSETVLQDSISIVSDTITGEQKKEGFFMKAYRAIDKILSPPRDPEYIDVQDYYNWCAELQVTNRFELLDIDGGSDFRITVAPKVRTRIGPFFGWRFAFLGYNIDIKSVFMNSEDMDLGGSIYSSAFGIDLFYRRVGGNYNIRNITMDGVDISRLLKGAPFDGINLGMTRVSFYYVPNYKHYSHQAAFSQTHRQLRSAGSLVLGAAYAHNRAFIDWYKLTQVINDRNPDKNYPVSELFGYHKNDEYSFSCGYGYNWVFAKDWLAACELTGAMGYLHQNNSVDVTKEEEEQKKEQESFLDRVNYFRKNNISINGNARLSVLWNNGPFFAGAQGVLFFYQYGSSNIITRSLLGTTYVFVGWNF